MQLFASSIFSNASFRLSTASSMRSNRSVPCDDIILEDGTHPFFELIKMLDSFAFSKCKEFLRIELNIDGLWERSSGQQNRVVHQLHLLYSIGAVRP